MKNNLEQFLNANEQIEPPKHLKYNVLQKINLAQQQKAFRKKLLFAFGFAASGISFIACAVIFGRELLASDFWSISMLSFTDIQTVASHWQEYSLSLLETFPALSVAALFAPLLLTMWLLKGYAQEFSGNFKFKLS